MKKKVLVTAIGTVTATSIVRELKKDGGFYIIGADVNDRNEVATALDTDEYYQFPYADSADYVAFALEFCKAHGVGYYYAVIDVEVLKISAYRESFLAVGTRLCVANHDFVEKCHFKHMFGEWVEKNIPQIAVREYKTREEAENAVYPLFIKPNEGVASKGCRKIRSLRELDFCLEGEEIGRTVIIQEYIDGMNITVDCIRNGKTGEKTQVQRKELLRNANGCGIAVEIFRDEKLAGICDALMEQLDLNGVVNMEFFHTGGEYKIIEINPRFSAGTAFTCMAGVNTVLNAMYIADGLPCVFGDAAVGAHFAERYEPYRMD